MTKTWLNIQEAAEMASVNRRTIYNWLKRMDDDDVRQVPSGGQRIRATALFLPRGTVNVKRAAWAKEYK